MGGGLPYAEAKEMRPICYPAGFGAPLHRRVSEPGGGYGGSQSYSGQSSVLQQARIAINTGNISRAEALLANYSDHNAEWNFLKGAVCYRRGWLDEALRYYRTACQMDPTNAEYRQALEYMEGTDDTAYRPGGGSFGTLCGGNPCMSLCCLWALCNGGGYWFCC